MTIAEVLAQLDSLRASVAALAEAPSAPPANPEAPFGYGPDGITPAFAPAYDACRPLWEAAQRDRVFSIFAYIGPGLQQGGGSITHAHKPDLQAMEDAIVALGRSPWGKDWITSDENAAMIRPDYQRKFIGYAVKADKDVQGNRIYVRVP